MVRIMTDKIVSSHTARRHRQRMPAVLASRVILLKLSLLLEPRAHVSRSWTRPHDEGSPAPGGGTRGRATALRWNVRWITPLGEATASMS